jgi:ATP-binding cassette subfamily B protein
VSVGSVAFVAGALAGASASLQAIFSSFSTIADQALFLTDLVDFFAVKPKITSRENALPGPRPIRDGYRFENVSFAYPGSSRTIIDGIDMHLAPGERLAVVGMNGAGKTTLVKLLVRLYDPTRGRILLDGIDLREYDIDSLHESTSVIFQDFVHYDMTARENIAVGRIGSITGSHPSDGIELAAALSHADAAIQRLPRGMDQMLGRRFDGGVDLSGGEWQKVALARAYLRDAQLLILDEPAAALDARAEFEVFERFASITEGKMAVLISHRFSTVRMSDRIVVLEGGRIIEEGSHDALIARGGQYASMFELQASSYR